MISKIKLWIHSKRLIKNDTTHIVAPTVQEDTRAIEAIKRVRKAFDQQEKSMNIRAMKRHSCANPDMCSKLNCFKHVPDKIIHVEIVPLKTKEELTAGIKK